MSLRLGYLHTPFLPEASLVYLHARYYAPTVYRFLQRDSLFGTATVPGSLHRYAYAHHNPLVYTDPTGHWAWPHAWYPGWGLDQLGGTILLEGGSTPGECWNTGLTCAQMQAWALNAPAELGGLGGVAMIGASLGPVRIPITGPPGSVPSWARPAVQLLGDLFGCSGCGTRSSGLPGGGWIIDHFPPTGMLPSLSSNLQQQFLGPHCATCSARQGWYVRSFIDAMNAGNTSLAQEYYSRLFYGYYTAWPWTGGWRLGP
jgi:RHS repeat-associated protein